MTRPFQTALAPVALLLACAGPGRADPPPPETPLPTITTVYSLGSLPNGPYSPHNPQDPLTGLMQASDGNLYGTCFGGGPNGISGSGTVYKLTLDGQYTDLHDFPPRESGGGNSDGYRPICVPVEGPDGALYGTTSDGGLTGGGGLGGDGGTIFRITKGGDFSVIHFFTPSLLNDPDGTHPQAGLVLANDGYFYGTTPYANGAPGGNVFHIDPSGADFATIYYFGDGPSNVLDGSGPVAPMIQGKDGLLYGTTDGSFVNHLNGSGTVFRISLTGTESIVHAFNYNPQDTVLDGASPDGPLIQGPDGSFYGITRFGGAFPTSNGTGSGTIFRIYPDGHEAILHNFDPNVDGGASQGGLLLASDGYLYGEANGYGGDYGNVYNVIFRLRPDGSGFTQLPNAGVSGPVGSLIQATDGNLYGVSNTGGDFQAGSIYRLNLTPVVSTLSPSLVAPDGPAFTLTVGGAGYVAGTTVQWNGAALTTSYISGSQLTAQVPASLITTSGTAQVSVANPTPTGGVSAPQPLLIATPTEIDGAVALQGVAAGSLAQPLTVTITPTNTPAGATAQPVTAQTVTPDPNTGAFTLYGVPAGTYTLGVKGARWLQRDVTIDTTGGSVTGLSVSLPGGDVNGDNAVSLADYVLLSKAYNSTPASANWDPRADLNCDGRVSLADYIILSSNYNKQGDK